MPEPETRLRALGAELAFPVTPDLAAAVESRLRAAPARRPRRLPQRRRLALALALLVAALGAVLATSPGARSAFLELFGIEGATVSVVDELPEVRPLQPEAALGERVTRAEAQRRAGHVLVQPTGLGRPDAIYVKEPGLVTFVYGKETAVRFVFSQVRGSVADVFYKKVAGGGTSVEPLAVNGEPGLFISGAPHAFAFVGPDGVQRQEALYLARDVLLWQRGPLTLRLEGELTRAKALELAGRVR